MNIHSKTIAFDNGGETWKTRYSFNPTNYAYIDKKLVTARQNQGNNELCWLHDQRSRPMNNFYNTQYKSSLKASFNDNVHNNKLYKSLSLEGTGNLRGGQSRFLANHSSQRSQARDAHVGKLRERGGILYAPLGRNKYISGRNVKLAGVVTGIEPLFDNTYEPGDVRYGWIKHAFDQVAFSRKYLLKIDFIPGFSLESNRVKILLGNATGGDETITGPVPPQQITGPTPSSQDTEEEGYVSGDNETFESLNAPLVSIYTSPVTYASPSFSSESANPSGSALVNESFNYPEDRNQFLAKSNTQSGMTKTPEGLIVGVNKNVISGDSANSFTNLLINSINNDAQNGLHLFAYAVTPGHVNGSDPKGQYADIDLQLGKHGYEDFELDVLNLNYEPTGLDHSK